MSTNFAPYEYVDAEKLHSFMLNNYPFVDAQTDGANNIGRFTLCKGRYYWLNVEINNQNKSIDVKLQRK